MSAINNAGEESRGKEYWAELAHKHWGKSSHAVRVNSDVIKDEIWTVLERDGFSYRSLLDLESLQALEQY